jgi:hypothetical protein
MGLIVDWMNDNIELRSLVQFAPARNGSVQQLKVFGNDKKS